MDSTGRHDPRSARPGMGAAAPGGTAPDPVPRHMVRDRILPYPRGHARRMTVLGLLLAAVAYALLFLAVKWSHPTLVLMRPDYTALFYVAALLLVPVHEALHVAAAMLLGIRWDQIQLGFRRGFIFVRFLRSLSVGALRIVLLAPLVVLGVPLVVFSLRSGDHQWMVLFAAHVGSTVADLYTFGRLRGIDGRHHFFHEPGVAGLSIFRPGTSTPPADAVPVATGLSVVAVVLTTVVFGLGPFLVPGHTLLGDMVLAARDERPEDAILHDYRASAAGRLRCTVRTYRDGKPSDVVRRVYPLPASAGTLAVRWAEASAGPAGTRVVTLELEDQVHELTRVQEPLNPAGVSTMLADGRQRVRLRQELDLMSRFTTLTPDAFERPGWDGVGPRTLAPDMTAVSVSVTFLP